MPENIVRIDFEPIGRRVEVKAGTTILDAARLAGIEIVAVCGGIGTCERCQVQVLEDSFSKVTLVEEAAFASSELTSGWRLACQTEVLASAKIHIPPGSLTTPQRLQLEGVEVSPFSDQAFIFCDLELAPPDLGDLRSDALRFEDALQKQLGLSSEQAGSSAAIPYSILTSLSDQIREWKWKARCAVRDGEVRAVLPPGSEFLGLAVDIGTTKVAAYLVNLASGEILKRQSAMNPQIHFGEDVISRIFYCMEHVKGRSTLQERIVETLNTLTSEMCEDAGFVPEQVIEAVVVGNTAMHHLFAGLPVQQLGLLPFVPAVERAAGNPCPGDWAEAGARCIRLSTR